MTWVFRNTVAGIFMLLMAVGCATELPEPTSLEEELAKRGLAIGNPVRQVEEKNYITGWSYVGRGNLIISFGESQKYLVTVQTTCDYILRHADRITVNRKDFGIMTDKDSLNIWGHGSSQWGMGSYNSTYCSIYTIHLFKYTERTELLFSGINQN